MALSLYLAPPSWADASNVALSLTPSSIVADGVSTSTATATVTDGGGNPVSGETVELSSGGADLGPMTDQQDGTYTATVTSTTTAGPRTLTATDGSLSGQATLTQTAGPATHIVVSLLPTSIPADGASGSTATATVTDAHGNPVSGETVELSSDGTDLGPMTDQQDGTYTATVTSTTTAGPRTIKAIDGSLSGQATLTQTAGPPANVALSLNPASIVADGGSTSTATATVTDANGNPVPGETVELFSGGNDLGPMTGQGDGTYTGTVTSTSTAGDRTISAIDGSLSGQATLTQTAGPATHVSLSLQPPSIVADGISTSAATATVTDANGNPVSGETVTLSSGGAMADQGGGTYTGTVTSTTTAGNRTITATDANVSGQATLTQTAGPAAHVSLSLQPSSIVADGASTATATATVTDANGNPVSGETLTLSSGGAMTDQGGGKYTGTVTSTTTAGNRTITVTDGPLSGQATLTQTPGPAAHVALSFNPSSIVANGTSTSAATATVTDANGNPVSGETVTLSSGGTMSDNNDGTYTGSVMSTTTAGNRTITATDRTLSGQATLTQTPGPAFHATLALQPNQIVANGISETVATLTVTDAHANRVPGETITFTSSDSGQLIGQVTDNGDGTYTTRIRSSTTLGQAMIKGTDSRANIAGQATLTQTVGPAAHVGVSLQPTSIVADGTSTASVAARVTDARGNSISGETVSFSSTDRGVQFGSVTDHGDGTYSATLTSSTTAGTPTVTATDNSGPVSGQATLTETAGPAARVTVSLQPSTIVANGISTSTATASVTDANGNPEADEAVTFSSTDPGVQGTGEAHNNHDGTYSAILTASNTPATATITASDGGVSGLATLNQIASPSTTALTALPQSAVSNQSVTLLAVVRGAAGPAHGRVVFESSGSPISGCSSQPVSPADGTATCTTSFGVGVAQLSAVFSPDAQSAVDASSGATSLRVGQDTTSVALGLSSPAVKINATETLVAFVTPAHTGSLSPTGTVTFLDNGARIARCASQSLLAAGGGGTATCAVSWPSSASHTITAIYNGDANFAGSQSSPSSVPVQFLGTLKASMHWSFVSGPGYTSVLALTVNGAPIGSTVLISCHGKGCPFANKSLAVTKTKRCGPKGKRVCQTHGNVDLTSRFAKSHLRPRATITVNVVQAGWIGRAYTFVVRSHKGPSTKAVCVAPGTSAPTSC